MDKWGVGSLGCDEIQFNPEVGFMRQEEGVVTDLST